MNSEQFATWMEKFMIQHRELDRVIDVLYDEIGVDIINFIDNIGFETYAINAMELALGDNEHWLTYFVYECEGDFDKFNENADVEDASPNIHTYEELYDFIMGRD